MLVLAVLAFALGSWAFVHSGRPWQLLSGDAYTYADIARRIASGRGFTVGALYPAELHYGVSADHPSLLRAPLWPLVLAGFFTVLGARPEAIQLALGLLFVGNVLAALALASRLAGRVAGALAGVAVASSPFLLAFTLDGLSELLFALLLTLVLLACAEGRRPIVLGVLCGLAYLARPNGIAALPAAMLLLAIRRRSPWPAVVCAGAFAAVASPWWIRNGLVAGTPFFSLYAWVPWYMIEGRAPFRTLLHVLEPSRDAAFAVHPLHKFMRLAPAILLHWPPLTVNPSAVLGVALACVRRDAPSLVFALLAAATTCAAALAAALGRYFVPLLPALLALGTAAWWRYGGRLRPAGLVLLLAAPLLPAVLPELADLPMIRTTLQHPPARSSQGPSASALARCLAERPLVMTWDAPRIAWMTGATTIHPAATRDDFWRIVQRYPVRFVQTWKHFPVPRDEFERAFSPRPDCGPGFYERQDVRAPEPLLY